MQSLRYFCTASAGKGVEKMSIGISGLASGMDIDLMVKNMMSTHQLKIDKLTKEKIRSQWIQEAFHDVNATLARFILDRNKELGVTMNAVRTTVNMSSNSLTWLKSAVSSDPSVVAATAGAEALDGRVQISVQRLADNWAAASKTALPEAVSGTSLASQFGLEEGAVIDFTVTTNKGAIRITSDQHAEPTEGVKLLKIDLNTHSLEDIARNLSQADIGITASYDVSIRRFFLQTSASGSYNTINIQDSSTGLGEGISGFMAASGGAGTSLLQMEGSFGQVVSGNDYAGVDALLDIGAAKGITKSSNEFNINGVNYSLKNTGAATVTVSTDVDQAYEKIKAFVDAYNELVDDLNSRIREKPNKDYLPLIEEEKKAMSDSQIEQWEKKAREGLLYNNAEISRMLYSIRTNIFKEVKGINPEYNSLFKIGITTEAYSASSGGKLVIDETRLKTALQEDAGSVRDLLFKAPDLSIKDSKAKNEEAGIINRIYSDIVEGMKSIINKAGAGNDAILYRKVQTTMLLDFITKSSGISIIDRNIIDYEKRLYEMNQRFITTQNRYYRQFDSMEKAISVANSQSQWLSMQLASFI
jgi:flagellar hook-associated protein 2